MPRVDGIDVLRDIKGNRELSMIPVVLMTSSNEERDREVAYRQGVNAYVVKPVEFSEFIKAVEQVGGFWAIVNEPPPGSLPKIKAPR
jgi:CheY-like chemotaxis protein